MLVVFFVGRVCSCGGPLSCGAVCRCVLGTEAVIFLLAAAFRVMFRAMPFSFLSLEAFSAGNALLFSGSLINSVQAMPFSFQASVIFCTGEGLLRYGICVPCKKQAPGVRDAFSEAFGVKNRLFRYGRDIRCKKQAPGVPNEISDARFLHCNQQFRGKWDTFCVLPPRFHRVLEAFASPAC